MEQRRLRLGDILDDYCPRERRVTNHAVVAMIEENVKQTRCTTCDAEHAYKGGREPRRRKKDTTGALYREVLADMPEAVPSPQSAAVPETEVPDLTASPAAQLRPAAVDEQVDDEPAVEEPVEGQKEEGASVTVGSLPTMFVRVNESEAKTPGGRRAGVIGFNVWMTAVDAPFQKAVDKYRSADGIVIDLRGNPGGLAAMMMGISGHFVPERRPLGIMKTRSNELRFVANPRLVDGAGKPVAVYGGPVAILVDAMSGSASECFSGGMQSIGRARVFGQTTMGQALPALFDKLPNGDVLIHAYGDFVTADGTRLEGRGVIPDESVPLARADLLAGRDRALQAALTWIDTAASGKSQ